MIAPFYANVDTRSTQDEGGVDPDVVRYSSGGETVLGRRAFGVTYRNVGYVDRHSDRLNSFQVVLIQREDAGPKDFDIEFNYDRIEWETAEYGELPGGIGENSAKAGISNGQGSSTFGPEGMSMEITGSGETTAFLDRNPESGAANGGRGLKFRSFNSAIPGRIVIPIRGGYVPGSLFELNAGPDQKLPASHGASTQLDASVASGDPSGLTYEWVQVNNLGRPVVFSDRTILNPVITLPEPGQPYLLQLIGTKILDGVMKVCRRDDVKIEHEGLLDVFAGEPMYLGPSGPTVTTRLPATASFNGGSLSFQWTQVDGEPATFSDLSALQPFVTLPAYGNYTFRLTVSTGGPTPFSQASDISLYYSSQNP